jgi:hypothetical protein
MRPRELADIVGIQLAWWQAGFGGRRSVLRSARAGARHPDEELAELARVWAGHVLTAPWWWRLARTSAMTAVVVLVAVAAEVGLQNTTVTAAVMVMSTVFGSILLTGAATWRRTRQARAIVPDDLPPATTLRRIAWFSAVIAGCVALLGVFVNSSAKDIAIDNSCPHYPTDSRVAWAVNPRTHGPNGCPIGPSEKASDGTIYVLFADGTGYYWIPTLHRAVSLTARISAAWLAHGGGRGELGYPVDEVRGDDTTRFVDFQHGSITEPPSGPVAVVVGRQYTPTAPDSCRHPDRPCLVHAGQDATGAIRLDWRYGAADAFNVIYSIAGRPGSVSTEVAGYRFTLPGPVPGARYAFAVEACGKRFLARSACTPFSGVVNVRTRQNP